MANVAITTDCRKKLAYVQLPDEHLRDTIERLIDNEIVRKKIQVPA